VTVCPECGDPAELRWTSGHEQQHGTVWVVVEQLPMLECERGHVSRPQVVDAARAAAEVPVATPGGVFARRRMRCGSCGEVLTMLGMRTLRSVTVTSAHLPPFTMTVDLPMIRCAECGVQQMPPDAATDLSVVLADLLG
jgi:hypothetical protein